MADRVALLRGINVGGNRRVPMAELKAAMTDAGFADVRSYVASGNLVFAGDEPAASAEVLLEALIARRFGFAVDVLVRDAAAFVAHAAANPLAEAAAARPKALHLLLTKRPPAADCAAALAERARDGEIVRAAGGALWIDYAGGVARSKLTPALIDRLAGSAATARNWTTVQALCGMLGA